MKTAWILLIVAIAFLVTGISLALLSSSTNESGYAIASGVCAVLAIICVFAGGERVRRIRIRRVLKNLS